MTNTIQIEGMDELIEAVGGGGGSSVVPTPAAADEGKVLTANDDGTASWEDASGVDMTGAQAGQVLTAIQDMGGNLIQGWTTPDDGLPEITSSIEQDAILAVGYSREPEWVNDITNLLPNGSKALVPYASGATNGYVLTNNNGTPAWAAASGGGGGVGFVGDTDINVVEDGKSGIWYLTYSPVASGGNIFNAKSPSAQTLLGSYLSTVDNISLYFQTSFSKFIVTEAHLENSSGVNSASDFIPLCAAQNIYDASEYILYYDYSKINSSLDYIIVVNGYFEKSNS